MADSYIETLREPLEAIERALTQPELWPTLTTPADQKAAGVVLDAAAVKARELRRLKAQAGAAKADAEREAHFARAREADYDEQLRVLEENLVRPLCEGWGTGKTSQIDTGYAKVALCRKPPSVILSEKGRAIGEDEVVTMLPPELVRIPKPEADRKAIKAALESGVVVPGFELQTNGLRIDWRS